MHLLVGVLNCSNPKMIHFYRKTDSIELVFFFGHLLITNVISADFVASFYWAYVFLNLGSINLILETARGDCRGGFKVYGCVILLDGLTIYS